MSSKPWAVCVVTVIVVDAAAVGVVVATAIATVVVALMKALVIVVVMIIVSDNYDDYDDRDDYDNDNIPDSCDNCPTVSNGNQADSDSDGVGNVCDNCPDEYNPEQLDDDSDNYGNACDNCPADYNPDQEDNDGDNLGDICDPDDDDDGILDDGDSSGEIGDNPCIGGNTVNCDDNCQFDYNPEQEDADGDGVGDVCQSAHSSRFIKVKQWRSADGGNDHWYGVLPELWFFVEADSVAHVTEKPKEMPGYLATITSQGENDFIKDSIINDIDSVPSILDELWLGGERNPGEAFYWLTGEPFIYENWAPGEPNHYQEDAMSMWGYHETDSRRPAGTWNNVHPRVNKFWAIVEWDGLFDSDDDGVADLNDNCLNDYNPDQLDFEGDGLGDVCDPDDDNDAVEDVIDNCPLTYNPGQEDSLGNGVGDACRSCCVGYRGNADYSPDDEVDLADITHLIAVLYLGAPGFECLPEANADGIGEYPDISDITSIIRYLYLDHTPLPECPLRDDDY